jgi:hypothetical protein
MDGSKQLELFDLNSYGCEQTTSVNSCEQAQVELVGLSAKFEQLELELFPHQLDEILHEFPRLAA